MGERTSEAAEDGLVAVRRGGGAGAEEADGAGNGV